MSGMPEHHSNGEVGKAAIAGYDISLLLKPQARGDDMTT